MAKAKTYKRLTMVLIIGLIVFTFLSVIRMSPLSYFYRPLFHDYWGLHERKGVCWLPIYGDHDHKGVFAFWDFRLNMVAVVSTGKPDLQASQYTKDSTPFEATLLAGTQFAVKVNRDADKLLICKGGNVIGRFVIHSGDARKISKSLDFSRSPDEKNIIAELSKMYGPEVSDLVTKGE